MAEEEAQARVRICHLSDTHGMHREIEDTFGPLPGADILIHTGDFTNSGRLVEYEDFNGWLGELRERGLYKAIVVIAGNHEWRLVGKGEDTEDGQQQRLPPPVRAVVLTPRWRAPSIRAL